MLVNFSEKKTSTGLKGYEKSCFKRLKCFEVICPSSEVEKSWGLFSSAIVNTWTIKLKCIDLSLESDHFMERISER